MRATAKDILELRHDTHAAAAAVKEAAEALLTAADGRGVDAAARASGADAPVDAPGATQGVVSGGEVASSSAATTAAAQAQASSSSSSSSSSCLPASARGHNGAHSAAAGKGAGGSSSTSGSTSDTDRISGQGSVRSGEDSNSDSRSNNEKDSNDASSKGSDQDQESNDAASDKGSDKGSDTKSDKDSSGSDKGSSNSNAKTGSIDDSNSDTGSGDGSDPTGSERTFNASEEAGASDAAAAKGKRSSARSAERKAGSLKRSRHESRTSTRTASGLRASSGLLQSHSDEGGSERARSQSSSGSEVRTREARDGGSSSASDGSGGERAGSGSNSGGSLSGTPPPEAVEAMAAEAMAAEAMAAEAPPLDIAPTEPDGHVASAEVAMAVNAPRAGAAPHHAPRPADPPAPSEPSEQPPAAVAQPMPAVRTRSVDVNKGDVAAAMADAAVPDGACDSRSAATESHNVGASATQPAEPTHPADSCHSDSAVAMAVEVDVEEVGGGGTEGDAADEEVDGTATRTRGADPEDAALFSGCVALMVAASEREAMQTASAATASNAATANGGGSANAGPATSGRNARNEVAEREGLGREARPAPFLSKLMQILNTEAYASTIHWGPPNELHAGANPRVIITDPSAFSRNILPHFFKHNKLSSFIQQLYTYGFRRVNEHQMSLRAPQAGSDPSAAAASSAAISFHHTHFRADAPNLLLAIKRNVPSNGSASTGSASGGSVHGGTHCGGGGGGGYVQPVRPNAFGREGSYGDGAGCHSPDEGDCGISPLGSWGAHSSAGLQPGLQPGLLAAAAAEAAMPPGMSPGMGYGMAGPGTSSYRNVTGSGGSVKRSYAAMSERGDDGDMVDEAVELAAEVEQLENAIDGLRYMQTERHSTDTKWLERMMATVHHTLVDRAHAAQGSGSATSHALLAHQTVLLQRLQAQVRRSAGLPGQPILASGEIRGDHDGGLGRERAAGAMAAMSASAGGDACANLSDGGSPEYVRRGLPLRRDPERDPLPLLNSILSTGAATPLLSNLATSGSLSATSLVDSLGLSGSGLTSGGVLGGVPRLSAVSPTHSISSVTSVPAANPAGSVPAANPIGRACSWTDMGPSLEARRNGNGPQPPSGYAAPSGISSIGPALPTRAAGAKGAGAGSVAVGHLASPHCSPSLLRASLSGLSGGLGGGLAGCLGLAGSAEGGLLTDRLSLARSLGAGALGAGALGAGALGAGGLGAGGLGGASLAASLAGALGSHPSLASLAGRSVGSVVSSASPHPGSGSVASSDTRRDTMPS